MIVSSVTGQPGAIVRLTSPQTTFSTPITVTFRYGILSTSSDTEVSLRVHLLTQLNVPVTQTLIATSDRARGTGWESASVCVPKGTYHVVFEATHGQAFMSNIVLDSVKTLYSPCESSNIHETAAGRSTIIQ
jgi:MAM domain, meprin/A5/mu